MLRWLIIAAIAAPPAIFGPAGMPDPWEMGEIQPDSITSNPLYARCDTLFMGTGSSSDVVFAFVHSSGNKIIKWDHSSALFWVVETISFEGTLKVKELLELTETTSTLDPENTGAGRLQLGVSGDADIFDLQGEWHLSADAVATYDSTATLAAGVHLALLDTAAGQDTLNLPAASSHSGRVVHIKAINANGAHVDGNGAETIDGSAVQDLNQYDAITIYCNGTTWYII